MSSKKKNIVDVSIRMVPDYDFALIMYPEKDGVHDGRIVVDFTPDKWNEVVTDVAGKNGELNILWYAFSISPQTNMAFRVNKLDDPIPYKFEYYNSGDYLELTQKEYEGILKVLHRNKPGLRDFVGGNEWIKNTAYYQDLLNRFDSIAPIAYGEVFNLKSESLQAMVFSNINIEEMINELGVKKLKVDGIEVERRIYQPDGSYTLEKKHNIYELLEVDTTRLLKAVMSGRSVREGQTKGYVIKCWCTSTNKEHYIWVQEDFAKDHDPLKAIASTFQIQKSLIPHIKELKRQGDIMLVTYNDPEIIKKVDPNEEKVALTPEQYFGLLVAET